MRHNIKLATTLALIALVGGTLSQPANAFDFSTILQNLAGGISGWTDLDTRSAEMSTQINAAASTGQLTADEANGYRLELARVNQVEAQIKASGRRLSATDSMSFTNSLNNLATRIQATIAGKIGINTTNLNDVRTLRAQLSTQLSNATSSGQLTRSEAANIRRDLEHNAAIETAFNTSGEGTLTAKQVLVLSDDLQKIKFSLDQQVSVGQSSIPQLNAHRNAVERKIADSLAVRSLTDYQANDFRRELTRIANMQSNFTSSYGALSASEILALTSELDGLSSRIDYQISLAQPGGLSGQSAAAIDAKQAQLTRRIDESLSSGRISSQLAADLRREMQHIAMLEAAYQSNTAGLSATQIASISSQLDEIDNRIGQGGRGDHDWRGGRNRDVITVAKIDTRRAQLLDRINDGQRTGKLSRLEASLLKREYTRITRSEDQLKSITGGRLSFSQSTKLWSDLGQLEELLSSQISSQGSRGSNYR